MIFKQTFNHKTTVLPTIMAVLEKPSTAQLLVESKQLIEAAKEYLLSQGKVVEISKYLTIKNYCKKYGFKDESLVMDLIIRGVILPEDVHTFEDLKGISMIKNRSYQ